MLQNYVRFQIYHENETMSNSPGSVRNVMFALPFDVIVSDMSNAPSGDSSVVFW